MSKALMAVMFCVCILGSAVGAGALSPVQTVTLTRLQKRGFVLKSYRTALGLTQAQLAVLTFPYVSATKISRLERGLDSATTAQEDAIAHPLDSIMRARLGPDTEPWLQALTIRLRSRP